ncbi:hypothetical protein HWV62_22269 [Athelia sp. TMB]|nr:hypothetical protein HWV62_22269 [Athelia sp. TMB]
MTRRKNVDSTVKPGKKSWVSGTKARFLHSHNNAWISATSQGPDKAVKFYSDVTKLFIKKYGWYHDLEKDLEEDTVDPTLESLQEPEEPVDKEETDRRSAYYINTCNRIRNYYYRHNKTVSTADTAQEIAEILETAADAQQKPPRRPQILHYYSSAYYPERIKPTVDAEWAKLKASAAEGEETIKFVDFQNKVKKRFWANETQAFRDNLVAQMEREHAANVKEFRERMARVTKEQPESAEAYHHRLSTAGATLNNLCYALGKRYGMNVSIFLCGPIGTRNGRIEMRSVHHGVTMGLDPKKWPQEYPVEFRAVQESMVAFTQRCYTPQQCKERSFGYVNVDADLDDDSMAGFEPDGLFELDKDNEAAPAGSTPLPSPPLVETTVNPIHTPNQLELSPPHKTIPIAAAPDFDPFGVGSAGNMEPPAGFDDINTDFFGNPENLTLLTEHLHGEQDQWDVFKTLMAEDAAPTNKGASSTPLDSSMQPSLGVAGFTPPTPSLFPSLLPSASFADNGATAPFADLLTAPRTAANAALPPDDATCGARALDPLDQEAASGSVSDVNALLEGVAPALPLRPSQPPSAVPSHTSGAPSPAASPTRAPSPAPSPTRAPSPAPAPTPAPSKRAHAASAPKIQDISVEFRDCPEASRNLYAPLLDVANEHGPEFQACVRSLLRFERAAGWTLKDSRLPSAGRPAEYKDWMQRARQSDFNRWNAKFGERLWLWWLSLQPPARMDENASPMHTANQVLDWGQLVVPGKSGLFLFVIGLHWWAQAEDGCLSDRWREAALDVAWVCEQIIKSGTLSAPAVASAKSTVARKSLPKRK